MTRVPNEVSMRAGTVLWPRCALEVRQKANRRLIRSVIDVLLLTQGGDGRQRSAFGSRDLTTLQVLELLLAKAQPDLFYLRLPQAFVLVNLLAVQGLRVDGEILAFYDYTFFPVSVLLCLQSLLLSNHIVSADKNGLEEIVIRKGCHTFDHLDEVLLAISLRAVFFLQDAFSRLGSLPMVRYRQLINF